MLGHRAWPAFTRSLRFRLTVSYVVLFTLALVAIGISFRGLLSGASRRQIELTLEEEFGEVKGFLRMERNRPVWFYDRQDPDEAAIVARIRNGAFLLTDSQGQVLESSSLYRRMGLEPQVEIVSVMQANRPRIRVRQDPDGDEYVIREGIFVDGPNRYFVSLGRSLSDSNQILAQFTRGYFLLMPLGMVLIAWAGWWFAGRALAPVIEMANAARAISSSNLALRLAPPGSNDELQNLVATFNSMMERLEQSFHQVRQFSTDVSHELRTPLTVIRGHLEVALMTAKTAEQYQESILTALQDVERISQIVRALLQLSQAESGQLALQHVPVDLTLLTEALREQFDLAAEEYQVSIETRLPPKVIVRGDRVQLERLLTNLVMNAIKYSYAGGRVTLSARPVDTHWEFVVEDRGQGIPAVDLPHIFDRFYRVRGREWDPEKGLGLGLSFVAWIVKAHEGQIRVESTVGQGSRFIVTLPRGGEGLESSNEL
ncbi:MAG: HAMP domain-containing protein [Bryobacteraceae bacterium]|nr:HAMP domain-containing protein [Bryobacteraceae bacterium]